MICRKAAIVLARFLKLFPIVFSLADDNRFQLFWTEQRT
jgi:hypothetical protein